MPKFQVSRSTIVDVPQDRVFDLLADYNTWTTWSPWLIADPEAQVTVSNPTGELGSTYAWQGEVTGQGILQHKLLRRSTRIEDDLNFIKPFKSNAKVVFELSGEPTGTRVTWSMDSSLPWFLFWMIPMMKTLISMDYMRGLSMFKDWAETGTIASQTQVKGVQTTDAFWMAGIASSAAYDQIGVAMEEVFKQAEREFQEAGLDNTGTMISVYTKFNMKAGTFDFICGYMLADEPKLPSTSPLVTWFNSAGRAFRVDHLGAYGHLGNAWSVANQLARHQKLKQSRRGTYEIYRITPPTAEDQLVTEIYLPLT